MFSGMLVEVTLTIWSFATIILLWATISLCRSLKLMTKQLRSCNEALSTLTRIVVMNKHLWPESREEISQSTDKIDLSRLKWVKSTFKA